MTTQAVAYSSNQKLWANMTLNDAKAGGEKIMIEFVKADKNHDDQLSMEEIKKYDTDKRNSTIKKVLIGAGVAVLGGLAAYFAFKGIKSNKNLKQLNENLKQQLSATDDALKITQEEFIKTKHSTLFKNISEDLHDDVLKIIKESQQTSRELRKADPLTGICSGYSAGAINFRRELQGGIDSEVKGKILKKLGVERIFLSNDYNGAEPLIGYRYQGRDYSLRGIGDQLSFSDRHSAIFNHIATGKFPEELSWSDHYYYAQL